MLKFTGEYKCTIDRNHRLKLPQRLAEDFLSECEGAVVMHCLSEGAVALYPEAVFQDMRRSELADSERFGSSLLARRNARRFGALSNPEQITAQGRITVPESYCRRCLLSEAVVLVGVEIGVEIWNAELWAKELEAINDYARLKDRQEIDGSLNDFSNNNNRSG